MRVGGDYDPVRGRTNDLDAPGTVDKYGVSVPVHSQNSTEAHACNSHVTDLLMRKLAHVLIQPTITSTIRNKIRT